MTDQQLHDFIAGIPAAKALADAGNDAGCADLLNTPGTTLVAVTTVPRDQFLVSITPAYLALADPAKAAVAPKWDRILHALESANTILVNPDLMTAAVADGVLTQSQADACWHRPGSPLEVEFGTETVVGHGDVSRVWFTYRPGGLVVS